MSGFQEWVTLIGAVIAAVTSSFNLWKTLRIDKGQVVVSFGSPDPPCMPGYGLYIISHANYPIRISDYGFIDRCGRLISLPDLDVNEPGYDGNEVVRGSLLLDSRGAIFEIGQVVLRDEQVGAYARIAGNERCFVGFNGSVSRCRRLFIACKHFFGRRRLQ